MTDGVRLLREVLKHPEKYTDILTVEDFLSSIDIPEEHQSDFAFACYLKQALEENSMETKEEEDEGDEEIFTNSNPIKIRLEFENVPEFHSIYFLFGLLAGRKLVFPSSNDTAIEFEMLYVGELAMLLAGIEASNAQIANCLPCFRWLEGNEVLLVTLEETR